MATHVPDKFEHSYSMLSVLKEMKGRSFICDFVIKIGDETFLTHRAVLAACSDYFVDLFSNNIEQVGKNWIELQGLNADAIRKCIDYMYTGEAFVTMENVYKTLQAAVALKLKGLLAICVQFLANSLTISNCLHIKAIAGDFKLTATSNMAERYAIEYCDLVIQTDGFQSLATDEVMGYMQNLDDPEKRWNTAISWIKGDCNIKKNHLASMLEIVMAGGGSFDFLFTVVWKENLVKESPNCTRLVLERCFRIFDSSDLTKSNCFELLDLGNEHKDICTSEILNEIRDFMAANFNEIYVLRGFRRLNFEDVTYIFECPYIQCDSDAMRWKAARSWVKSSIRARKPRFCEMLQSLKIEKFGFTFILNVILNDPLVKRSEQCVNIVLSSFFSMMKITDINLSNWFYIFEMAKQYNGEVPGRIMDHLTLFAAANFSEISDNDYFVKLEKEDIYRILDSPLVSQCSDKQQWQAIKKWVISDKDSRVSYLPELLEQLSIHDWRFDFLYTVVQNDYLIKESESAENLIVSAYLYALVADDITTENCFMLLETAKEHETDQGNKVIQKVYDFMADNFESVREREGFIRLQKEDIIRLLQLPQMSQCSEVILWNSIIKWIKFDVQNREESLTQLLQHLHLKRYSFAFLFNFVYNEPLVKECRVSECAEMVISGLFSALTYRDIDEENWFILFQLAKEYDHLCQDNTMNMLKNFMENNFEKINTKELDKNEFIALINTPQVSWRLELKWKSAMIWIKSKLPERKEFLPEIVTIMKPQTLPFHILYEAESESIIRESQICKEMIVTSLLSVTKNFYISLGNWSHLRDLAREYAGVGPTNVVQNLREFMMANFSSICLNKAFIDLDQGDIVYLLSSPKLAASEEMKADAALKWVKAKGDERAIVLPTLFNLVKLKSLSKDKLKKIRDDKIVSASTECKDVILAALLN